MVKTEECPVCKNKYLKVLKTQIFILPTMPEYDSETSDIAYQNERMQILFDKILKNREPAVFDIDLCLSCGLVFLMPRFTVEEIKTKYQAINAVNACKRVQKRPALKVSERAQRIYSLIAGLQREGFAGNTLENLRILDFGGAQGHNLVPFINGNSCYLIDYMKHDLPTGVDYLGADESDLQGSGLYFDVILLCHTLEHAAEPINMIEMLSAHLVKGGLIYVEVPLGCFIGWDYLTEPLTHINFFSEESLFKLFSSTGLRIVHLSTSYQWVTHKKSWCINIIGRKDLSGTDSVSSYKTTRQQMNNPRYYLPLLGSVLGHPKKLLRAARRRLKSSAVL